MVWLNVTNAEWIKYGTIFYSLGPMHGYLTGEKARDFLLKSQLPLTVLSRVWNLCDVTNDNLLNINEFCSSVLLIRHYMTTHTLPDELPRELHDHFDDPPSALHPISDNERRAYEQLFVTLDERKCGFISGDLCKEVFSLSRLSQGLLSDIWLLSDLDGDGQLSLWEWIIASHLTRLVKEGFELNGIVNVFDIVPDLLDPSSLKSQKNRVDNYEKLKVRLVKWKDKRKTQLDLESQRLTIFHASLNLLNDLLGSVESCNKIFNEDDLSDLNSKINSLKTALTKLEQIVDRLKEEHEHIRQETVKIILDETQFRLDAEYIKTQEQAIVHASTSAQSHSTKDPDPFHQLHEQRKEDRRKGRKSTANIDTKESSTYCFNPFYDRDVFNSLNPFSQEVVSSSHLSKDLQDRIAEFSGLFLDNFGKMHEKYGQYMLNWYFTLLDPSVPENDPIFRYVTVEEKMAFTFSQSFYSDMNTHQRDIARQLGDITHQYNQLMTLGQHSIFRDSCDYTTKKKRVREDSLEKARNFRRKLAENRRHTSAGHITETEQHQLVNAYRIARRSLSLEQQQVIGEALAINTKTDQLPLSLSAENLPVCAKSDNFILQKPRLSSSQTSPKLPLPVSTSRSLSSLQNSHSDHFDEVFTDFSEKTFKKIESGRNLGRINAKEKATEEFSAYNSTEDITESKCRLLKGFANPDVKSDELDEIDEQNKVDEKDSLQVDLHPSPEHQTSSLNCGDFVNNDVIITPDDEFHDKVTGKYEKVRNPISVSKTTKSPLPRGNMSESSSSRNNSDLGYCTPNELLKTDNHEINSAPESETCFIPIASFRSPLSIDTDNDSGKDSPDPPPLPKSAPPILKQHDFHQDLSSPPPLPKSAPPSLKDESFSFMPIIPETSVAIHDGNKNELHLTIDPCLDVSDKGSNMDTSDCVLLNSDVNCTQDTKCIDESNSIDNDAELKNNVNKKEFNSIIESNYSCNTQYVCKTKPPNVNNTYEREIISVNDRNVELNMANHDHKLAFETPSHTLGKEVAAEEVITPLRRNQDFPPSNGSINQGYLECETEENLGNLVASLCKDIIHEVQYEQVMGLDNKKEIVETYICKEQRPIKPQVYLNNFSQDGLIEKIDVASISSTSDDLTQISRSNKSTDKSFSSTNNVGQIFTAVPVNVINKQNLLCSDDGCNTREKTNWEELGQNEHSRISLLVHCNNELKQTSPAVHGEEHEQTNIAFRYSHVHPSDDEYKSKCRSFFARQKLYPESGDSEDVAFSLDAAKNDVKQEHSDVLKDKSNLGSIINFVKLPNKVDIYRESLSQESETTDTVDRESIKDSVTTREQFEKLLRERLANSPDSHHDKNFVRHWSVRIPKLEKTSISCTMNQFDEVDPTESIIAREIRLSKEREEMVRREHLNISNGESKQSILSPPGGCGIKSEWNFTPTSKDDSRTLNGSLIVDDSSRENENEIPSPLNAEVESRIQREIMEQHEREVELKKQRPTRYVDVSQKNSELENGDAPHNFDSSKSQHESLIEREMREMKLREEELKKDRAQRYPRSSSSTIDKTSLSPSDASKNFTDSTISPNQPLKHKVHKKHSFDHSNDNTQLLRSYKKDFPKSVSKSEIIINNNNNQEMKETPIEREIRLTKEREDEYRKQMGLLGTEAPSKRSSMTKLDVIRSTPGDSYIGTAETRNRQYASNRLRMELASEKRKEEDYRRDGKILKTSEERIEPPLLPYIESPQADPATKHNFIDHKLKTPEQTPSTGTIDYRKPDEGQSVHRRKVSPSAALFSYKESRHSVDSIIERELKEMQEREQELRNWRLSQEQNSLVSNGNH